MLRPRIELVAPFDEPRGGRGIEMSAERHHHDVALEGSRVVRTLLAAGSMERMVVCTKRRPGLSMEL